MSVMVKRIYDEPDPMDGDRILVDRLWPRGMRKEKAALSDWIKDVAPTPSLRKWFSHDPQRWVEFQRCYREELLHNPAVEPLRQRANESQITLLYGARDREHNHALVLADFLMQMR